MGEFKRLAAEIDGQDFDHVFRIVDGHVVDLPDSTRVRAPAVFSSDDTDIDIDGQGWSAFSGFTCQYGYGGAVMHSSEGVGCLIAEAMSEYSSDRNGVVFALVVVDVLAGEGDEDPEPAGWAIVRREIETEVG